MRTMLFKPDNDASFDTGHPTWAANIENEAAAFVSWVARPQSVATDPVGYFEAEISGGFGADTWHEELGRFVSYDDAVGAVVAWVEAHYGGGTI